MAKSMGKGSFSGQTGATTQEISETTILQEQANTPGVTVVAIVGAG